MAKGVGRNWPEPDRLVEHCKRFPSMIQAARALDPPCADVTLRRHLQRIDRFDEVTVHFRGDPMGMVDPPNKFDDDLRHLISGKQPRTVEQLADILDCAPHRVRDGLEGLRNQGFRVPDQADDKIVLERVVPEKVNLHRSLLDGNEIQIGLVSDTHLSSNEEALAELELAYDVFAERGIPEVLHAGDWTCGMGIFRTQGSEIRNHTFESQVAYLADHYPRRKGIVTRGISGNHDIEGDFGRMGANPVVGLAHRRDDIEFLGDYSAWVNYGTDDNPCWLHLLHGKGGMSYAYSYKAQKLVDGYPGGRKPAVLAVGHWHVSGWINQRSVNVVWPGCFEWRSPFMTRLGLSPSVGFHILHLTVADDGSLVRFRPEWMQFYEGRHLEAT